MLGTPSSHPSSPDLETPGLQIRAHDFNDLFLCQPCLNLNRIERGLVIPRHFYYRADFVFAQVACVSHVPRDMTLLEDVTQNALVRLLLV